MKEAIPDTQLNLLEVLEQHNHQSNHITVLQYQLLPLSDQSVLVSHQGKSDFLHIQQYLEVLIPDYIVRSVRIG